MREGTMSDARSRRNHRRPRWSLRTLLGATAIIGMVLGGGTAYFRPARLEGDVFYNACACGGTRARIVGGALTLTEENHDTPAGTTVALVHVHDGICTLTEINEDGSRGRSGDYPINHTRHRAAAKPPWSFWRVNQLEPIRWFKQLGQRVRLFP